MLIPAPSVTVSVNMPPAKLQVYLSDMAKAGIVLANATIAADGKDGLIYLTDAERDAEGLKAILPESVKSRLLETGNNAKKEIKEEKKVLSLPLSPWGAFTHLYRWRSRPPLQASNLPRPWRLEVVLLLPMIVHAPPVGAAVVEHVELTLLKVKAKSAPTRGPALRMRDLNKPFAVCEMLTASPSLRYLRRRYGFE